MSELVLHPKQSQIFRSSDDHRFIVAVCGRRFGKTKLALAKLIKAAAENPNPIKQGFYWYIAPTFGQAKDIAWKMLNELCDDWNVPGAANESELTRYVNKIPIKLMGAENMPRLKGVALYGVVCDEYASWKNGRILDEAILPTLQDTKGWCWIIGTPTGYNFFYDLYEYARSGQDKDFAAFHFSSYENPLLDAEELERTRQRYLMQGREVTFKQEYLAEFAQVTGAIWKDFSREHHIVDKYIPDNRYPIYASIDFGFALGHATSFLLHEVRSDQIITFDGFNEYQKDPKEVVDLVDKYVDKLTLHAVYADSARPDLIELLRKNGLIMREANKDVELGIAKVAEFMKINPLTNTPQWVIAEHLKDPIRQIENYQWEDVRGDDGHFRKVPKKEDDDACDSLRYFLYSFNQPKPQNNQFIKNLIKIREQETY